MLKKQKNIYISYAFWTAGIIAMTTNTSFAMVNKLTHNRNEAWFNLSIIRKQMKEATKATSQIDAQNAIIKMYQNGTIKALSFKMATAAIALGSFVYANKDLKNFVFQLGQDKNNNQWVLLTIANKIITSTSSRNTTSSQIYRQNAKSSATSLALPKLLPWITTSLKNKDFGILFEISQNQIVSQTSIHGNKPIDDAIKVQDFTKDKIAQIVLQNALAKKSQYGNKIIWSTNPNDFGLTRQEINKIQEPLLATHGAKIAITYKTYDFHNKFILAGLTIITSSQTKAINIAIRGFGAPKISLKDKTQVGLKEFKGFILPNDFSLSNKITKIGASAFENAILPRNFIIPSSVKSIGVNAFANVILPKNFKWPKNVTNIVANVFKKAKLFKGFTIPSSVTHIDPNAFDNAMLPDGCVWFDKHGNQIDIPIAGASVALRFIILWADSNKKSLKGNQIIPSNKLNDFGLTRQEINKIQEPLLATNGATIEITYKGYDFHNKGIQAILTIITNNLTKTINIVIKGFGAPKISLKDKTRVQHTEFYHCILPSDFRLPNSVTTIQILGFANAILPAGFRIPNTVTSILPGAFYNVTLPIGFTIPKSVTMIHHSVFWGAILPQGFTIPNGITRIFTSAFHQATLPPGFAIPESATYIEFGAFYNVILPDGFAWFDKHGNQIDIPVAGAKVEKKTT